MLEIVCLVLGPVETNAYLVADVESKQAVAIDPAWDGPVIVEQARRRGWNITQIWLTHAHFDHIGGEAGIVAALSPAPEIALHPDDLPLWQMQGGAPLFGIRFDAGPQPSRSLVDGQRLELGAAAFEVRHVPGHTPGHVLFYCSEEGLAFCGDVIFAGSIGRTDLPGGSYPGLIESIRTQVLSMPDTTRLLSGHGPETTVGEERLYNPFLQSFSR